MGRRDCDHPAETMTPVRMMRVVLKMREPMMPAETMLQPTMQAAPMTMTRRRIRSTIQAPVTRTDPIRGIRRRRHRSALYPGHRRALHRGYRRTVHSGHRHLLNPIRVPAQRQTPAIRANMGDTAWRWTARVTSRPARAPSAVTPRPDTHAYRYCGDMYRRRMGMRRR